MRDCRRGRVLGWSIAIFLVAPTAFVAAQAPELGVGFRAGVARLDGDINIKPLRPEITGVLSLALRPHLRLGGEVGFADLALGAMPDTFVLRAIPVALNLTLRFAPYGEVTPFVTLGGGGTFWKHLNKRTHQPIQRTGRQENNFDFFLQTAGGLELALSSRTRWTFGASYRYSFSDHLDALKAGDWNDAVVSAFTGFTFHFGKTADDIDSDGVIDRYDLNSKASEDRDGYLDHDGVPDKRMGGAIAEHVFAGETNDRKDQAPPVVIHEPVLQATVGSKLQLYAEIFENRNLCQVAILYRPANTREWQIKSMQAKKGIYYAGTIPASAVQKAGIEYCIVAVDEAVSGVGYSGLPERPNFVRVHGKETAWRAVTGLAAAIGWGAASYLVFHKQ